MTTYEQDGAQIIIHRDEPPTRSVSVVTFANRTQAEMMFAELQRLTKGGGLEAYNPPMTRASVLKHESPLTKSD